MFVTWCVWVPPPVYKRQVRLSNYTGSMELDLILFFIIIIIQNDSYLLKGYVDLFSGNTFVLLDVQ